MELIPFTENIIPDASRILAARHARNRMELPELPPRFEDPVTAAKALSTLLAKPTFSGFAAIQNGKLAAYLIGETTVQPWGRCGYVYLPGYGLAEGENPSILQDLYALLGETWNQRGCFLHYAYLSSADANIVNAWFDLGFGKERVDALLDLRTAVLADAPTPPGIEIRRVVKGDNANLASLSDTIWRHQTRAPRWHPMMPEDIIKHAEGWGEVADTETDIAFLAFENGEAVGSLGFYVEEEKDDDMTVPAWCRYMTMAATKDSHRGRGIASALTWHGLKAIRDNGDEFCLTNWQSANLLAARFWPRFGFKTVAFRLGRPINPAIAWGRGNN